MYPKPACRRIVAEHMTNEGKRPEPNWWSEFEAIVYPQWAPALVLRALVRTIPAFLTQIVWQTAAKIKDFEPNLSAFALVRYPFVLDLAYRKQRTNTAPDPRQTIVAEQFGKSIRAIKPQTEA